MAFNYAGLAATATRLIQFFGSEVSIVKTSPTPTDPAVPWGDVDETDEVSVTVQAAVVDATQIEVGGEIIRRGDFEAWVEVPADGTSLLGFHFLVKDGARYKIDDIEEIKPATVVLAYRMTLSR